MCVCFTVQKISPDTKDKVQLQVVLQQGGANSFHFANPAGRTKQIEERDSVKELLQQLLPRFRRKVNADLEEKNRWVVGVMCDGTETVQVTLLRRTLLPDPNAAVAISKGLWAVKLCSDKILQFLTGDAG